MTVKITPEDMIQTRRDAIEAAFRRLPILAGREEFLPAAVDMLTRVDGSGPGTPPLKFRALGSNETQKELEKLARRAEALAECFETLHKPAINALADMGLWKARLELPVELLNIASKARHTGSRKAGEAPKGGKPINKRNRAVVIMLAHHYHMLTGKEPRRRTDAYKNSMPYGPFAELVDNIFNILGILANRDHIIRVALTTRKKRESNPPKK